MFIRPRRLGGPSRVALLIPALLTACDPVAVEPDAEVPLGTDSGSPPRDAGPGPMPGEDAGGRDAGFVDSGSDAGPVPLDDAGPIPMDDAGPVPLDDAGPIPMDAGGEPARCANGSMDGDETDVDCGGTTCARRCDATDACMVRADCASNVCIGNVCIASSCSDGIQNGAETDRDCGGGCTGCANGRMCSSATDCAEATAMCLGGYCQPGSCADGTTNNAETDQDCGGGTCAPCANGRLCSLARDCVSGVCGPAGVCLPVLCTNEVRDGTEVGVDCGGDCPGCPDGTMCTNPIDCYSGRCETVCTSCADNALNGTETDVDCGGECGGCGTGAMCMVDSDCAFGDCLDDDTCDGPASFYFEDFEGSDGGWVASGTNSTWAYGTPAGAVIDAAHSGTGAWVTNLSGDYNSGETSYITSPVIDLSAASEDPLIFLALNWISEARYDFGTLQVSTDGTTWTRVGEEDSGTNWYNHSSDSWHDDSDGWVVASHVLTGTAGEASVQIRMRFTSDSSGVREGFGIDDVVIRAPIPNLSVSVAALPDICGGAVATLTNNGESTTASVDFITRVAGVATVDTITDLEPGDAVSRTVFASDGELIEATFSGALDADPSDDIASATMAISRVAVGTGSEYHENFDADDGGWVPSGATSSWEWGTPANTIIATADSGTSAWVTNLDGEYGNNDRSVLLSPCVDASTSPVDLLVGFAIQYESEANYDELTFDFSTDGGLNWTQVDVGTNWYDPDDDGFNGSSAGWVHALAELPRTAGKNNVRLRFQVFSDSSNTDEGFGIDTVMVLPGGNPDLQATLVRTATCGVAEARVSNVGTSTVSAYALTTTADGVSTRRTIIEPLLPGQTATYPVMGATAGVLVELHGDVDPSNNEATLAVNIPVTAGYVEQFDTNDGGYRGAGMNSSWEHGAPAGTFISGPASGVNAWVTNLGGPYNSFEFSTLTSPCFDFTALTSDPTLTFAHIYETEACCDRGWVEVSVDGGTTWTKLGRAGEGTNWYDDTILDWWNGTSGPAGAWRNASHVMSGTAGHDQVRFRFFVFTDDEAEMEGFGVDDITITP